MRRFDNDVSPRDVCRVLFRHQRKIVAWVAGVLAVTLALTFYAPAKYRSECKLLVRLGRENVLLDPTIAAGTGPVTAIPPTREGEINSIVEILRSRGLHEQVVDSFGAAVILDGPAAAAAESSRAGNGLSSGAATEVRASLASLGPDSTPGSERERAVERLAKELVVEPVKRSDVIHLQYEAGSPEFAQRVLQKLVDLYLDRHRELHRTPGAHQFFSDQAEKTRERLEQTAEELRELKNSTGIASVEDQRRVLMLRSGELTTASLTSQSELAAAERQVESLKKRLESIPQQVEIGRSNAFSGPAAGLSQQIQSLQAKERVLLAEHGADDARTREAKMQLERIQEAAGGLGPSTVQINLGANRLYDEARVALFNEESRVVALRATHEALEEQLAATRAELRSLNDHEVRMAHLERELQLHDAGYRKYAENLEQARIDEALHLERISNIRLAEAPTLEPESVSPRPVQNAAIGMMVALLGGVILAFGSERADHSIKTPRDLEQRLDVPTLVSIPRSRAVAGLANGHNGNR